MTRQSAKPEQLHSRLAENLPHGAKAELPEPYLEQNLPFGAEVVIARVDDPWPAYLGEQRTCLRSTRGDPLASMLAHDFIDQTQYYAGRMWQRFYESSLIGGVKAVNTMQEAVDSGQTAVTGLTDHQIRAFRQLDAARQWLGRQGDLLVHCVLAQGLAIKEIALMRGYVSRRSRLMLGARFRECLEELAELWGLSSPTHHRQR